MSVLMSFAVPGFGEIAEILNTVKEITNNSADVNSIFREYERKAS